MLKIKNSIRLSTYQIVTVLSIILSGIGILFSFKIFQKQKKFTAFCFNFLDVVVLTINFCTSSS